MMQLFDLFDDPKQAKKLYIKVTPKAKSERIKKEMRGDGSVLYKVYVTAAAENNKANEAALKLLAKALGISKSSLTITHGHTSREKIIEIS